MKIYLDNCCFNRPFDNQNQMKIKLETEAKLFIQSEILNGKYQLVWSFILEYENLQNIFEERRQTILDWKMVANEDVEANEIIVKYAKDIQRIGLKAKDSLHIACAIYAQCECFITTDMKIINKFVDGIEILNPIDFVRKYEVVIDED